MTKLLFFWASVFSLLALSAGEVFPPKVDPQLSGANPEENPLRLEYIRYRQGVKKTEAKIINGPWLQQPNPGAVTVSFNTLGPVPAGLDYREMGQQQWTRKWNLLGGQIRGDLDNHNFHLTGLKENSVYEYRTVLVEPKKNELAEGKDIYSFTTFTAQPQNHQFFATGDTQFSPHIRSRILNAFLKNKQVSKSDFIVTLGDVANIFHDFVDTHFFGFLDPLVELTGHGKPYVPVRGNHELRGEESSLWFKYFGSGYRGFRCGDAYYIVLDGCEDKPSRPFTSHYTGLIIGADEYMQEQAAWLQEIVKTPEFITAGYRIVLCHSAPFAHNGTFMQDNIRKVADSLFAGKNPPHKIHLWLSGHIHTYRRTIAGTNTVKTLAPIKSKTTVDGADYPFTILAVDGPGFGGFEVSGVIVNVTDNGITVDSIDVGGNSFDRFFIGKDGKVRELGSSPELKECEMPCN